MDRGRECVVTGVGVTHAVGVGRQALATALRDGRGSWTAVERSPGYHRPAGARLAGLIGDLQTSQFIPPMSARRMSRPSRHGVVAAALALADAGLPAAADPDDRTGVALATAFGPTDHTQKLLDQILFEGPAAASPALFTECVANAAAAQIAIRFKLRGPNYAVTCREAGAVLSIGRAARVIAAERAPRMLCGSVEEVTPIMHAALDRFGALARAGVDGEERPRPFGADRNGFVVAEGAGVVLLETRSSAERRGAPVLGRLAACGGAFDPTASRVGWGTGAERLATALRRSLARDGIAAESIAGVVSGASGSRAGDRLEAHVLHCLFGGALPPIATPKAVTGEYGGGFIAAAVLAAGGAEVAAPSGAFDRSLELVPAPRFHSAPGDRVLVTSLASGGAAGWFVLEREGGAVA